ncbi:TPA: hypothetical protein ACS7ZY_001523 [Providencia alcalifaciens]
MSNNTRYSVSRVFTKNDLITIKKLLREDKSPKEMYQYLANKGDRYALFAGLSGSESGFWGKYILYAPDDFSFFNYDEKFQEKEFENIDFRLANEYIVLLENKLNQYGGELVEITDISYEELLEINRKACIESWFSFEDWYLYAVFESLSQNEKQGFWTHRLNSSTDFKEQVNHHYKTFDMMIKKYVLSSGANKEIIKSWLTNNFYISMGRTLSDSQFDEFAKIRDSESEISIIMKDAMGSIKTNERVLGDVVPWVFDEVDADEILTEDALLSMGSEVNESILFWETKEEKLKFLMNEVNTNRHNRRKKRSVLFDNNERITFELNLQEAKDIIEEMKITKNPQVLYNYLEANGERYGEIPNGLIRGDSYSGKMATNYLVEKAKQHNIMLDHNDLKRIQLSVALETGKKLLSKFDNEKTTVLRKKFTIRDIEDIHDKAFISEKLPKEAWTLSIPLKIIPLEEHDEIYSEMLLNSGNNQSEVEYGLYLMDKMIISIKNNPSKEKFNIFLEWANTVSTVDNMVETGFVFGEYIKERSATFTEYMGIKIKELREVIPVSDLEIYGTTNSTPATRTPPINREVLSPSSISHPHNMVDKSIVENIYPTIEPDRELAPLTTNLLDILKPENTEVPTNHYLERPSVVLPGTDGFKDFPEDRIQHSHHFENMIGHLSDNMSSMNHSSSSFDRDFRIPQAPSIPEFNYSGGYSSPSSRFSF